MLSVETKSLTKKSITGTGIIIGALQWARKNYDTKRTELRETLKLGSLHLERKFISPCLSLSGSPPIHEGLIPYSTGKGDFYYNGNLIILRKTMDRKHSKPQVEEVTVDPFRITSELRAETRHWLSLLDSFRIQSSGSSARDDGHKRKFTPNLPRSSLETPRGYTANLTCEAPDVPKGTKPNLSPSARERSKGHNMLDLSRLETEISKGYATNRSFVASDLSRSSMSNPPSSAREKSKGFTLSSAHLRSETPNGQLSKRLSARRHSTSPDWENQSNSSSADDKDNNMSPDYLMTERDKTSRSRISKSDSERNEDKILRRRRAASHDESKWYFSSWQRRRYKWKIEDTGPDFNMLKPKSENRREFNDSDEVSVTNKITYKPLINTESQSSHSKRMSLHGDPSFHSVADAKVYNDFSDSSDEPENALAGWNVTPRPETVTVATSDNAQENKIDKWRRCFPKRPVGQKKFLHKRYAGEQKTVNQPKSIKDTQINLDNLLTVRKAEIFTSGKPWLVNRRDSRLKITLSDPDLLKKPSTVIGSTNSFEAPKSNGHESVLRAMSDSAYQDQLQEIDTANLAHGDCEMSHKRRDKDEDYAGRQSVTPDDSETHMHETKDNEGPNVPDSTIIETAGEDGHSYSFDCVTRGGDHLKINFQFPNEAEGSSTYRTSGFNCDIKLAKDGRDDRYEVPVSLDNMITMSDANKLPGTNFSIQYHLGSSNRNKNEKDTCTEGEGLERKPVIDMNAQRAMNTAERKEEVLDMKCDKNYLSIKDTSSTIDHSRSRMNNEGALDSMANTNQTSEPCISKNVIMNSYRKKKAQRESIDTATSRRKSYPRSSKQSKSKKTEDNMMLKQTESVKNFSYDVSGCSNNRRGNTTFRKDQVPESVDIGRNAEEIQIIEQKDSFDEKIYTKRRRRTADYGDCSLTNEEDNADAKFSDEVVDIVLKYERNKDEIGRRIRKCVAKYKDWNALKLEAEVRQGSTNRTAKYKKEHKSNASHKDRGSKQGNQNTEDSNTQVPNNSVCSSESDSSGILHSSKQKHDTLSSTSESSLSSENDKFKGPVTDSHNVSSENNSDEPQVITIKRMCKKVGLPQACNDVHNVSTDTRNTSPNSLFDDQESDDNENLDTAKEGDSTEDVKKSVNEYLNHSTISQEMAQIFGRNFTYVRMEENQSLDMKDTSKRERDVQTKAATNTESSATETPRTNTSDLNLLSLTDDDNESTVLNESILTVFAANACINGSQDRTLNEREKHKSTVNREDNKQFDSSQSKVPSSSFKVDSEKRHLVQSNLWSRNKHKTRAKDENEENDNRTGNDLPRGDASKETKNLYDSSSLHFTTSPTREQFKAMVTKISKSDSRVKFHGICNDEWQKLANTSSKSYHGEEPTAKTSDPRFPKPLRIVFETDSNSCAGGQTNIVDQAETRETTKYKNNNAGKGKKSGKGKGGKGRKSLKTESADSNEIVKPLVTEFSGELSWPMADTYSNPLNYKTVSSEPASPSKEKGKAKGKASKKASKKDTAKDAKAKEPAGKSSNKKSRSSQGSVQVTPTPTDSQNEEVDWDVWFSDWPCICGPEVCEPEVCAPEDKETAKPEELPEETVQEVKQKSDKKGKGKTKNKGDKSAGDQSVTEDKMVFSETRLTSKKPAKKGKSGGKKKGTEAGGKRGRRSSAPPAISSCENTPSSRGISRSRTSFRSLPGARRQSSAQPLQTQEREDRASPSSKTVRRGRSSTRTLSRSRTRNRTPSSKSMSCTSADSRRSVVSKSNISGRKSLKTMSSATSSWSASKTSCSPSRGMTGKIKLSKIASSGSTDNSDASKTATFGTTASSDMSKTATSGTTGNSATSKTANSGTTGSSGTSKTATSRMTGTSSDRSKTTRSTSSETITLSNTLTQSVTMSTSENKSFNQSQKQKSSDESWQSNSVTLPSTPSSHSNVLNKPGISEVIRSCIRQSLSCTKRKRKPLSKPRRKFVKAHKRKPKSTSRHPGRGRTLNVRKSGFSSLHRRKRSCKLSSPKSRQSKAPAVLWASRQRRCSNSHTSRQSKRQTSNNIEVLAPRRTSVQTASKILNNSANRDSATPAYQRKPPSDSKSRRKGAKSTDEKSVGSTKTSLYFQNPVPPDEDYLATSGGIKSTKTVKRNFGEEEVEKLWTLLNGGALTEKQEKKPGKDKTKTTQELDLEPLHTQERLVECIRWVIEKQNQILEDIDRAIDELDKDILSEPDLEWPLAKCHVDLECGEIDELPVENEFNVRWPFPQKGLVFDTYKGEILQHLEWPKPKPNLDCLPKKKATSVTKSQQSQQSLTNQKSKTSSLRGSTSKQQNLRESTAKPQSLRGSITKQQTKQPSKTTSSVLPPQQTQRDMPEGDPEGDRASDEADELKNLQEKQEANNTLGESRARQTKTDKLKEDSREKTQDSYLKNKPGTIQSSSASALNKQPKSQRKPQAPSSDPIVIQSKGQIKSTPSSTSDTVKKQPQRTSPSPSSERFNKLQSLSSSSGTVKRQSQKTSRSPSSERLTKPKVVSSSSDTTKRESQRTSPSPSSERLTKPKVVSSSSDTTKRESQRTSPSPSSERISKQSKRPVRSPSPSAESVAKQPKKPEASRKSISSDHASELAKSKDITKQKKENKETYAKAAKEKEESEGTDAKPTSKSSKDSQGEETPKTSLDENTPQKSDLSPVLLQQSQTPNTLESGDVSQSPTKTMSVHAFKSKIPRLRQENIVSRIRSQSKSFSATSQAKESPIVAQMDQKPPQPLTATASPDDNDSLHLIGLPTEPPKQDMGHRDEARKAEVTEKDLLNDAGDKKLQEKNVSLPSASDAPQPQSIHSETKSDVAESLMVKTKSDSHVSTVGKPPLPPRSKRTRNPAQSPNKTGLPLSPRQLDGPRQLQLLQYMDRLASELVTNELLKSQNQKGTILKGNEDVSDNVKVSYLPEESIQPKEMVVMPLKSDLTMHQRLSDVNQTEKTMKDEEAMIKTSQFDHRYVTRRFNDETERSNISEKEEMDMMSQYDYINVLRRSSDPTQASKTIKHQEMATSPSQFDRRTAQRRSNDSKQTNKRIKSEEAVLKSPRHDTKQVSRRLSDSIQTDTTLKPEKAMMMASQSNLMSTARRLDDFIETDKKEKPGELLLKLALSDEQYSIRRLNDAKRTKQAKKPPEKVHVTFKSDVKNVSPQRLGDTFQAEPFQSSPRNVHGVYYYGTRSFFEDIVDRESVEVNVTSIYTQSPPVLSRGLQLSKQRGDRNVSSASLKDNSCLDASSSDGNNSMTKEDITPPSDREQRFRLLEELGVFTELGLGEETLEYLRNFNVNQSCSTSDAVREVSSGSDMCKNVAVTYSHPSEETILNTGIVGQTASPSCEESCSTFRSTCESMLEGTCLSDTTVNDAGKRTSCNREETENLQNSVQCNYNVSIDNNSNVACHIGLSDIDEVGYHQNIKNINTHIVGCHNKVLEGDNNNVGYTNRPQCGKSSNVECSLNSQCGNNSNVGCCNPLLGADTGSVGNCNVETYQNPTNTNAGDAASCRRSSNDTTSIVGCRLICEALASCSGISEETRSSGETDTNDSVTDSFSDNMRSITDLSYLREFCELD